MNSEILLKDIDKLLLQLVDDHGEESLVITADKKSVRLSGSTKGKQFLGDNPEFAKKFHQYCFGIKSIKKDKKPAALSGTSATPKLNKKRNDDVRMQTEDTSVDDEYEEIGIILDDDDENDVTEDEGMEATTSREYDSGKRQSETKKDGKELEEGLSSRTRSGRVIKRTMKASLAFTNTKKVKRELLKDDSFTAVDSKKEKHSKSEAEVKKRKPSTCIKKEKENRKYETAKISSASGEEEQKLGEEEKKSEGEENKADASNYLLSKMNLQGNGKYYVCSLCKLRFKNETMIQNHILLRHPELLDKQDSDLKLVDIKVETPYGKHICQTCGLRFQTQEMIENHIRLRHPRVWKKILEDETDILVSLGKNDGKLQTPEKQTNKGTKKQAKKGKDIKREKETREETDDNINQKFGCKECPNLFTEMEAAIKHVENFHSGKNVDELITTDVDYTKTYTLSKNSSNQVTVKREILYDCGSCDEQFRSKILLDKHRKKKHAAGTVALDKMDLEKQGEDKNLKRTASKGDISISETSNEKEMQESNDERAEILISEGSDWKEETLPKSNHEISRSETPLSERSDEKEEESAEEQSESKSSSVEDTEHDSEDDPQDGDEEIPESVSFTIQKAEEESEDELSEGEWQPKSLIIEGAPNSATKVNSKTFQLHEFVKGSEFKCYTCNEIFSTMLLLDTHMTETKHTGLYIDALNGERQIIVINRINNPPIYKCSLCKVEYNIKENCQFHIEDALCRKVWRKTCPMKNCNLTFDNNNFFMNHMITFHNQEYPFPCGSCSKTFLALRDFECHLRFHQRERNMERTAALNPDAALQCGYCKLGFDNNNELKHHKETVHDIDKTYVCEVCGKKFRRSDNLRNHKKIHMENRYDPELKCKICDKVLLTKDGLRHHVNVTHSDNKPYVCEICGYQTKQLGNLKHHVQNMHSKTRPYKCSIEGCNQTFKVYQVWQSHMQRHALRNDDVETAKSYGKLNQCDVCLKYFTVKTDMNNHKLSHTDEKKLSCDLCGTSMKRMSSLRRHMRNIHGTQVSNDNDKSSHIRRPRKTNTPIVIRKPKRQVSPNITVVKVPTTQTKQEIIEEDAAAGGSHQFHSEAQKFFDLMTVEEPRAEVETVVTTSSSTQRDYNSEAQSQISILDGIVDAAETVIEEPAQEITLENSGDQIIFVNSGGALSQLEANVIRVAVNKDGTFSLQLDQ